MYTLRIIRQQRQTAVLQLFTSYLLLCVVGRHGVITAVCFLPCSCMIDCVCKYLQTLTYVLYEYVVVISLNKVNVYVLLYHAYARARTPVYVPGNAAACCMLHTAGAAVCYVADGRKPHAAAVALGLLPLAVRMRGRVASACCLLWFPA